MSTRTTSGVLAVLAGILVVPAAAQAVDAPTTTTSETAPPVTTEKSTTTTTATTTVPTITEPAPSIPPITTTTSPSTTTTSPSPTTTATTTAKTDTTATVPRGNRSNAPEGDDAEQAKADQDKQTRAEKRREARAAKKQAKKKAAADKKKADKKDAKAKKDEKKDDATADDAATTTEQAPAAGTTSSDDPAAMAQDPVSEFSLDGLDAGLASQVPNFFINQFKIPPFLLPIYQAAGIQYGIRWEILAAINEIETDYGRNLNISSAGAQGWMQFMPATWAQYGLDANGDDKADPYNPVDAIFSAARYLKAAGSDTDIRKAIFAYNHADWYVNSVLARARLISVLPTDLVGSLVGLTQGIFPVTGKASYVGADETDSTVFAAKSVRNAEITAKAGADAVAVQDGTITAIGESVRLGKFVKLRDVYGNVYTYAHLDTVAETYAAAKDEAEPDEVEQTGSGPGVGTDPAPRTAASAGKQPSAKAAAKAQAKADEAASEKKADATPERTATDDAPAPGGKERVYANPDYAAASSSPSAAPHGDLSASDPSTVASKPDPLLTPEMPEETTPSVEASTKGMVIRPLRKGSRVVSGTKLGTIATTDAYNEARGRKRDRSEASVESSVGLGDTATDATDVVDQSPDGGRMTFEIRPAGDDAPRIDPRPILEGWQLLQTSSVYAAHEDDNDALFSRSSNATAGQVLLMTKAQLQRRVLADKNLDIYPVGRQQIGAGLIDRRVLATLAYLSASGHKISVSSLFRPGSITSSGNVSDHSSGNAIDIASVDGEVISAATQGRGSVTDTTIKRLLQLQGTVRPHQIISLMTPADFGGADNILALPDHDDHIHVGFAADAADDPLLGRQLASALKPGQWDDLIDRLGKITNPKVSAKPSKYALKVKGVKKTAAERSNGD
jgi:soluble lytic murein transglycosylase-like protein